jgi:hypothetical protein
VLAVGCLIPFVLLVAGAAIGAAVGGTTAAYWGCAAGFAVGLIVVLLALRWFGNIRGDRP